MVNRIKEVSSQQRQPVTHFDPLFELEVEDEKTSKDGGEGGVGGEYGIPPKDDMVLRKIWIDHKERSISKSTTSFVIKVAESGRYGSL